MASPSDLPVAPPPEGPSVAALLRAARQRLVGATGPGEAGESPHLDAEVLLRHVLGVSRAALLTHPQRRLTPDEVGRYQALVERRASAEPVAYLTGEREFMGLTFAVDRRTLIPRPETETLVERALPLLSGRPALVVDVGTGSGAIAVSVVALAAAPAALRVVGIDRSWEALQVGRANAARLVPAGRARPLFLQSCLLRGVRGRFDLVLANLPYVAAADLAVLPAPVARYEPRLALDGGGDGLDLYRALLADLPGRVAPGGAVLLECDPRQAGQLGALLRAALPEATVQVHRDLAGRERVVEGVLPGGV
ncbi:MAG TPA: peptide chain release factor N(5)-glutamine methyltransferase [Chloroflexota bacterium]|nr:peptide chain release factor N(5)-glutamine methyltransferase [Chloroflexota bacterium]